MLFDVGLRTRTVETEGNKHKRKEVMVAHGFRKWMDTRLTGATKNPVVTELLLGHDIGLKGSYFKPDTETLLGEYRRGMHALIIDDSNRLLEENIHLKSKVDDITLLQIRMEKQEEQLKQFEQYTGSIENAKQIHAESLKLIEVYNNIMNDPLSRKAVRDAMIDKPKEQG
jgi:hypothetical protein